VPVSHANASRAGNALNPGHHPFGDCIASVPDLPKCSSRIGKDVLVFADFRNRYFNPMVSGKAKRE
jgi:hypothetical protein